MYSLAVKKYYEKNKEKIRSHRYKKYGMSLSDVIAVIKNQNGLCDCCGVKMDGLDVDKKINKKSMHRPQVDHDHKSLKNRGIICASCNFLLGRSYDDVSRLEKAIIYLNKYKSISSVDALN